MKQAILFLFAIFTYSFSFSFGLKPSQSAQEMDHLEEVNKQWKTKIYSSQENISFNSDIDRIQFHLLQVESLLRKTAVSGLEADQIAHRIQMLDVLHDYALQRKFPVNSYHAERQPYFIDIFGTHCAVGYLVKASGYGEISQQISKTQNYAYVHEIQSLELVSWSRKFGFSLDELALIQPTYGPSESYDQVQEGANGDVTVMRTIYDSQNGVQDVYIAGTFTLLNDLPCLNIGKYANNQLSCLGNGIDGKIVEISQEGNNIVVAGEFLHNGTMYPMAIFNGTSWTYEGIPNRPGSKATAYLFKTYPTSSRKIAINHPIEPDKQEIWEYKNSVWSLIATVNGTIYVIHNNVFQAYAGVFDSITFNTTPLKVFESKNAIMYHNHQQGDWITVDNFISDTVFTIHYDNEMLFLGGSASTLPSRSNVCVTRFLNGACQPLMLANQFDDHEYVVAWDIDYFSQTEIIVAGKFSNHSWMYQGKNLMRLDKSSNNMLMMSELNKPVRTIGRKSDAFLFGGEFTGDYSSNNLKHIVKLRSLVGVKELSASNFQISPNPSTGEILVSGEGKIRLITISDLQGKTWIRRDSEFGKINATDLPAGAYLVRIENESGGFETFKWVKI